MNKISNCNHKWIPSCSFAHPYKTFTTVVLYVCSECGATYISHEPKLFAAKPKVKSMGKGALSVLLKKAS